MLFLVFESHIYHGCDCSNYEDKDSFAIVCLKSFQKLTYYFAQACSKPTCYSSGVCAELTQYKKERVAISLFSLYQVCNNRRVKRWHAWVGSWEQLDSLNEAYNAWGISRGYKVIVLSQDQMTRRISEKANLALLVHLKRWPFLLNLWANMTVSVISSLQYLKTLFSPTCMAAIFFFFGFQD